MIKHNRRLSVLLSMGVLLMLLLTGCDSSGSSSSYKAVDSVADNSVNTNQSDSTGAAYESSESGSNLAEGSSETLKDRKIIQKYNYCVETKNFDELINKLTEQVNKLNGYVESSSLYSSGYNSSLGTRTVNYVIRIPKESTESMTEFIASNSVVTSKEMTTEDVTLKYGCGEQIKGSKN